MNDSGLAHQAEADMHIVLSLANKFHIICNQTMKYIKCRLKKNNRMPIFDNRQNSRNACDMCYNEHES